MCVRDKSLMKLNIDTSVSRSEDEMEEMEGEEGGGTKSLAGSSMVVLWI